MKAPNRNVAIAVLGWVLAVTLSCPSISRAAAESEFTDTDRWKIELTPLLWIAGIEGDVETRFGADFSTSADFADIFENLDFGAMLHAEVSKGKFAVLFDGVYMDVDSEATGPLGQGIDGEVRLALADVGVGYRFVDAPLADSGRNPRLMLDGLAGVRYVGVRVKLEPELLSTRSRSADLFDPYVGGRVLFAATDRLTLVAKGTIGGFGVGADLDWTAGAFVDYQLAQWCSVVAGYYIMGLEFEDGGRLDGLDFDATFHGPVVGMTFRF